jgi:hypothetical protein
MSWISDIKDIANRLIGIGSGEQAEIVSVNRIAADIHAMAIDVHAMAADIKRLADFTLQTNVPAEGRLSFGAPKIN